LENVRRYSAPDAAIYDAVTAPLLDGFFGQVAGKVAGFAPGGRVLEVGSGPGRLAVRIAQLDPDVRVAGVDLAPEMVERADALAARCGVADRVAFRVGDVASLPFAEASFDAAVSTFSLHHWDDRSRGLAEVHRVLRPGGVAVIYDLAGWIRRFERGGPTAGELAVEGPYGRDGVRWQGLALTLGPIPLAYRAELRRERAAATDNN